MRSTSVFALAGAIALTIGSASPALAGAPIIDQSNLAPTPVGAAEPLNQIIANNLPVNGVTYDLAGLQFVTAGMTGLLTQVDLQLAKAGAVAVGSGNLVLAKGVSIDGSGNASGTIIGQIGFLTSSLNDLSTWTSFDVSGLNLELLAGEQFAFAVLPTNNLELTRFRWAYSGDAYSGGSGYLGVDPVADGGYTWIASSQNISVKDYGFRTWMQAVPEPDTWLLMIVGFGFIGFALRRRKAPVLALTA